MYLKVTDVYHSRAKQLQGMSLSHLSQHLPRCKTMENTGSVSHRPLVVCLKQTFSPVSSQMAYEQIVEETEYFL